MFKNYIHKIVIKFREESYIYTGYSYPIELMEIVEFNFKGKTIHLPQHKEKILELLEVIKENKIDGIIATNTTINFPKLHSADKNQKGGLSGKPLYDKSNELISFISQKTKGKLPIIGVGGIITPDDAIKKLNAGAHLIQLYTGLIYEGPGIVKEIKNKILADSN